MANRNNDTTDRQRMRSGRVVGRRACKDWVRVSVPAQTEGAFIKAHYIACAITLTINTGADGARAMVGTGFASQYRLKPRASL